MKNQKLYFTLSAISAIISAILSLVTNYLNETQLVGSDGSFRQSLQTFTAYGFLIFLALFVLFLIIGIVKKIKSK